MHMWIPHVQQLTVELYIINTVDYLYTVHASKTIIIQSSENQI